MFRNKKAFTLIELMITAVILTLVLGGLLQLFAYCLNLAEISTNLTLVVSEVQGKLEEIRNHDFSDIADHYGASGGHGDSFPLDQLNGTAVIYINNSNSQLLAIEIAASWATSRNQVVGEDKNLNGALDAGEDDNGNGKLDSPATVTTLLAKR